MLGKHRQVCVSSFLSCLTLPFFRATHTHLYVLHFVHMVLLLVPVVRPVIILDTGR